MKNIAILILLFLLIFEIGKSQDHINRHYGKGLNEVGRKCIMGDDSTILLFGSGQESSFVLYKIKSNGDTIYSKKIDLPYFSLGNDILACPNGDLILIGDEGGIVKTNNRGDIIWSVHNDTISQTAGVLINDTCFAIAGQRPIFSHIEEVPDLGPRSVFYNDIYICLYNQSGKLLKNLTYSFVDGDSERSNDIIYTSKGKLTVLGNSYLKGMPNEFLLTTDLELNVELDTIYEYSGILVGNELMENSSNNYVVCGKKYINSENDLDVFVQEVNPGGNIEWEKTFDLHGLEDGTSVIEAENIYYITGQNSNKRGAAEQYSESFLLKLDNNGDTIFSKIYKLPDWQTSIDLKDYNDTTLLLFGSTNYHTFGGSDFHLIFCDKSNGYSKLTITSANKIELNSNGMFFPNPANDAIWIKDNDIESLTIIDPKGLIIKNVEILMANQKVSIFDLKPGFYILRFETKTGIRIGKLLKQ